MKTALAPAEIPGKDRLLSERDKLVALSFAVLVILLGYALIVEGVSGIVHDDGIYVITAKAIAQGDGYRLIHLPDSPVQTKYPFLYPAILSVIWKLFSSFPGNLLLMQWVSLLSGAATVALAYLYLIRFGYCSRGIAAAAVSLCATSAAFLFLCTTCMSEMPFALCVVLALWALDRHVDASLDSRKAQLFLGMLLALPMLVRINGFVAVLVVLLLALRYKRIMRWPAIGAVLITMPFAVWLLTFSKWSHADSSSAYYTNYIGWWHSYGIPFLGRVTASNAFDVCYGLSPISQIRWLSMPYWISVGAALIGLAGLTIIVRQIGQWKILPLFLAAYLAVVIVWPWPPFRFLTPVLPYLLAYSITAIIGIFSIFRNAQKFLKPVGFVLLGILLIANADAVRKDVASSRANHYPGYMLSFDTVPMTWSSYDHMFNWIKQHTKSGDLFVSEMDPMLYLYTGRRSFRPYVSRPGPMFYKDQSPAFGRLEEVMAYIKSYKAQYLVLSPMPGFSDETAYFQFVVESQRRYPGWLERVYLGKDTRFAIWKIADSLQPTVGSATLN